MAYNYTGGCGFEIGVELPWWANTAGGKADFSLEDADASGDVFDNGRYALRCDKSDKRCQPNAAIKNATKRYVTASFGFKNKTDTTSGNIGVAFAILADDFGVENPVWILTFKPNDASANNYKFSIGEWNGSSYTQHAITSTTFSPNTWYWVQFELDSTNDEARLWVDETEEIGWTSGNPVAGNGGWEIWQNRLTGKSGDVDVIWDSMHFTESDTAGDVPLETNGEHHVIGHQPANDITGKKDWTISHGSEAYLALADYRRSGGTAGDDISSSTSGELTMCGFADLGGTSPTVDLVNFYYAGNFNENAVDTHVCTDGNETTEDPDYGYTGNSETVVSTIWLTTPDNGDAWTETLFNKIKAGPEYKAGSPVLERMLLEAFGDNLDMPTASATGTSDESACPTASVSGRRRMSQVI